MANPIRRLVQLILDKAAAQKTEDDAKRTLGGVDASLKKVRDGAMKLAAAFAAAFAVGRIIEFGKAALREAAQGDKEWRKLANTIRATGENFDGMRAELDAASKAFQSATQYGAGEYLEALDRMVTLTGDVAASTNNMGLVANVAAQFFDGELGPATDLVAKAMNGNVIALGKMGIQAGSAQEALEILAERSMGAAAARADTLGGRMSSLTELYNDFLSAVGETITESDGAGMAMNFLTAGVQTLTEWVYANADTLKAWVTGGIRFAIASVDVLYRAITGTGNVLQGAFNAALGVAVKGLAFLVRGYEYAIVGASGLARALGRDALANDLVIHAAAVKANADALNEWADAAIRGGSDQVGKGLERLASPVFNADMFATAPGGARPALPGGASPMVGRNQKGAGAGDEAEEEADRIENRTDRMSAALMEFGLQMERSRILSDVLGADFDALGAEAQSLEATIAALAAEGLEPTDELFSMLTGRLGEVRAEMKMLGKVTQEETENMQAQAAVAGVLASALGMAMAGGLGPFAKQKARQNLLEAAELGIRATIAALTGFGAAKAGAFAAAAGRHLSVAAAWGALGASVGGGGGGGGGGTTTSSSSGGGGTITPTTARTSSSAGASRAQPIGADVAIYLTGPGFDALNPEVQRVVRGAIQESGDRYGNARVRVVRRNGPT